MKCKKIISMALILAMMAIMLIVAVPTASATDKPVDFMWGYAYSFSKYGTNYSNAYGYVEVENISYNKSVTIHYSTDYGNTWSDTSATYFKPTLGNKEAWYFNFNPSFGSSLIFAIKYEVGGQTYWDNNDGQNYSINNFSYLIGNCGLKVRDFYANDNNFSGNIILKNLAYNKDVRVRYTTDNWATFKDISATYDGDNYGQEYWEFSDDLTDDWDTLEFVAYYTVNGTTYWDNNFGANYTITR